MANSIGAFGKFFNGVKPVFNDIGAYALSSKTAGTPAASITNYIGAYQRSRVGAPGGGTIGAYHWQKTWTFANSIGAYNHDGINDIGAYEGTAIPIPPEPEPEVGYSFMGAYALGGSNDIGSYQTAPFTEPPPTTTVFITDVNGTESWDDGDTGLPITGTGFV